MESLPAVKVHKETAHSLYTTNDGGVNEVAPGNTVRRILAHEDP